MVSAQFIPVGAGTLERGISTIGELKDANGNPMPGYDDEYTYATTMKVWDPTTEKYTTYGWSGSSAGDIDDMPELNNLWLDATTEETDDTVATTSGVWIKAGSAGTFTVSGEVPNTPTVQLSLVAGLNLVANPYPAAVPVASFGTLDSTMSGYDDEYTYATTMKVWDPATEKYTTYGWSGTSAGEIDDMPELNNQWLDATTEATTDVIPYGAGVWIKAEKAGTITFKNPASAE